MNDWFNDESFWSDLYSYMFSDENFETAEKQTDSLLNLLSPSGKSVLDLCCGPGRFSLPLAKRGYRVTGVDKSPFLLRKATENALKSGVDVEWIENDMRAFERPGSYDFVINMFSSFGYFEEKDDDKKVLSHIHSNLKSGGACIFEMMGKECMARIYQPTMSSEFGNGSILIHRHEIVDDWTRVKNEWILIEGEKVKTYRPLLTLYSAQEMKILLSQTGFIDIKIYGDLEGTPYNADAKRLVVTAKKP